MHNLKAVFLTAASLLSFVPCSSAEMTAMSLQERMRQADAVVVGEIIEARGTEIEMGVESWVFTCRVERYLKQKVWNPNIEEAKNVGIIHIVAAWMSSQKPAPIKLVKGKRYLLFLKEAARRDNRDKGNVYGMITDYHGAFEAGQDYFIHDEQSPEYPQAVKMSFDEIVQRVTQKNPVSVDIRQQPERELSEDELRMKERLIALSRGEGALTDLRVELMDGGMAAARFYNIADGKIISQQWDVPGSLPKREERAVTDEEIRQLLRTLIEHQYWTFQGTQFIPDAPGFLFRFYYKDLPPVDYRCDAHEYEPSAQLSAIRSVWLSFVSGVPSQDQASCEAQGGHWGRFGMMEKEQCNRPTTDAGKECSDHGECESDCVTDDAVPAGTEVRGKCFEWTLMLGRCFNGVKDGNAQGVICVD